MTDKAPVEAGERFVSRRTGRIAVVESVSRLRGQSSEWRAQVVINGTIRTILVCSRDGIKGHVRKA